MPQMYPMNWFFLTLFFIFIFGLMIIICYYMKMNLLKKKMKKITKNFMNWKW